jgi:HlyD family secretion protein
VGDFDLKVGDVVEKGEVLLKLDDRSLPADILQARSELLAAQIALEKMQAADTGYQDALHEASYQELLLQNKYDARHEFYGLNIPDERVEEVYDSYKQARDEVTAFEAAYEQVRKLEDNDPQRVAANDALQAGILKRDSLLRALSQIMGTPFGHRAEMYFIAYDQQVAAVAEAWAAFDRYVDDSDELAAKQAEVYALQNIVDQASIIAPFSGTVTAINAVAGEQVAAGAAAVQLEDLSNLVVDVEISQMQINQVVLGQKAEINIEAIPGKIFLGEVVEIAKAGDTSSGETLFPVRVALQDADAQIRTGFTATISIITKQAEDALLVPNSAIQYDKAGSAYVMTAGKVINVTLGAKSDAFSALVSSELKEGDALELAQTDSQSIKVGSGQGLRLFRGLTR